MNIFMANDYNQKKCPVRRKIKGLITIVLSEPRNDYNHTSDRDTCPAQRTRPHTLALLSPGDMVT